MQKKILAMALCALIPMVSIAVANAGDYDEEYEDTDYEDYEDYADDSDDNDEEEFVEEEVVETRTVAKRMNCNDIKKEMDRLSAAEELDDVDVVRLTNLKTDYRSKCMKRAAGRSSGRSRIVIPDVVEDVDDDVKSQVEQKSKSNVETGKSVPTTCDNPDKNGCCPGETYTDLGDLGFNCCQADGVTCFPPIVTK